MLIWTLYQNQILFWSISIISTDACFLHISIETCFLYEMCWRWEWWCTSHVPYPIWSNKVVLSSVVSPFWICTVKMPRMAKIFVRAIYFWKQFPFSDFHAFKILRCYTYGTVTFKICHMIDDFRPSHLSYLRRMSVPLIGKKSRGMDRLTSSPFRGLCCILRISW